MKTKTQNNGFDYVVAALNLKVTAVEHKKSKGRKKRSTRQPDGTVRSATKFVLVVLANHRNHKTGQCNPSHTRLADLTGYGARTITFELKALKGLGIAEWKHGWGNVHGKVSSRYTLNLAKMQELGDESAAVTGSKCTPCHLTSKEPPIPEPPSIEPSATHRLFKLSKPLFEAEEGSHPQLEESASAAHSSASAPTALSSDEPFAGIPTGQLVTMLPHAAGMVWWNRCDKGTTYDQHRAEIINDVLEYQKAQEAVTA